MSENRGETTTNDRNPDLWEKGTLRYLTTVALNKALYKFAFTVPSIDDQGKKSEKNIACDLLLTFNDSQGCTISTNTAGCTASGSGQWTYKGEPKAWGDKDRDLLELNYNFTIDYVYNDQTGETCIWQSGRNAGKGKKGIFCQRSRTKSGILSSRRNPETEMHKEKWKYPLCK